MDLATDAELQAEYAWFPRRTRFLPALDEMLRHDKRGAIDDMLKVLRERGVLRAALASQVVRDDEIENYGADFLGYTKRRIGDMLGSFLHDNGMISFKQKPSSYDTTDIVGEVEVVVPRP